MTCGLIMTKNPATVASSETVGKAARQLLDHHWASLPVTDDDGRFVGMFGVYDILCQLVPRVALAGGLLSNLRFVADDPEELRQRYREISARLVGEVASRDVTILHPDTPEIEALRLFCKSHTTLPVVERGTGKLAGIVSPTDAMRAITGVKALAGV